MIHLTQRVTITAIAAVAVLLGGCSGDSDPEPTPTSSATSTPTAEPAPTEAPTGDPAEELPGTWRDDAVDWTVHFAADGTYTVDYQGLEDFLTGTWTRDDSTVTLTGLDGYAQVGTVTPEGIVFDLGTLTKR